MRWGGVKPLYKNTALMLAVSSILSTSAWAKIEHSINEDGTLVINSDETVNAESKFEGKSLNEYENVEIHFSTTEEGTRPLGVYSARYDASTTNITVYIDQGPDNNDSLHLTNHFPYFHVRDYSVFVNAKSSDAMNLSRDITTNGDIVVYGNLIAQVKQGNGIRANASIKGEYTSSITVEGKTNITINGDQDISSGVALPTAVWAGSEADWTLFQKSKGKGVVYLKGDTNIILKGKQNYGLHAGKNGYIEANNIYITGSGTSSYGIAATELSVSKILELSENKFGNIVVLNGESNIISMQDGSHAIYATGQKGKIYSGEKGIGYLQANGIIEGTNKGNINLTVRDYVNLTGTVVASSSGDTSMNISGALNVEAPDSTPGYDYTAAIVAGDARYRDTEVSDFSQVTLTYGKISSINGDILSGYGGDVDVSYSNSTRSSPAAMMFNGNALAANGGTIDLTFGNGSIWVGRSDDYQDADNADWNHSGAFPPSFSDGIYTSGDVNVNLGNNSQWVVTGQSWITNITANNSTIDLTSGDAENHAIHIGHLEGTNNTFVMNLSMDGSGNMIYVKDGTDNTQNIAINNRDEVLSSMDVGDKIRFATIANSQGGFDDADISDSGAVTFGRSTRIEDAGINNVDFAIVYEDYDTNDSAENDKYNNAEASNGSSIAESKPGSDYVDSIYGTGSNAQNAYLVRLAVPDEGGNEEVLSDAGRTIINMSRANYSNAVYLDTLNKRQGEARYGMGQDNGIWVRMRHDNIGKEDSFRSHNTMFEVGYDFKSSLEHGELHSGIAFDYMNGQNDYHNVNGDGELNRYGAWLYTTWFNDDGQYADFVLKYGHIENDFDIYASSTGEKISGDYSNDVISLSGEYGWKFTSEKGWYIEPQAQLQYSYVTSADYTTSQNSKVDLDAINSLIGRVGFRAGKDFADEYPITAYIRGDVMHEFLGDQDISAFDNTGRLDTTYENDDTWYNVGVGLSVMTSQNTYFFIEGEQSFGADNEDTYTVAGGFRHNF